VKVSRLHLMPDRRDRFALLEPKIWLDSSLLRTWVIAEPALIVRFLRDPNAVILNVDELLEAIERAYGVEFHNVRYAARHLPLFLEGKAHSERRRDFSHYLAGRLAELDASLPGVIERHLLPLREKGLVELVSEVTGPMVRAINGILVGRPLSADVDSLNLLDLFALNKSVARFKDLDRRIKQALEFLMADHEDEVLLAERFTALAMGFETLMTMLTEGLVSAFNKCSRDFADHAALPDHPIETGVPVSYRKIESDLEISGHEFKAGDLLRLQLQTLGYVPGEADRGWMFGAGAHSCIGKQVSLRIWTEFKRAFDTMRLRGVVKSYELAPSHYSLRHNCVHIEVSR
jgi:cytochrome P450